MTKLYPILDTGTLRKRNCSLRSAAGAFLASGVDMLQIRHKEHWSRDMFAEAEAVAQLCRRHGATLIVNDRADIAMLLDAGLHVGQDDLPAADARRLLGGSRVLGLSTHNPAQLAAARMEPVDYIALGPVFGTVSKENPDPLVGVEVFRDWRALVRQPVVAIGGITRLNARRVLDAGADSVAVIGDLLPEVCTGSALQARMEEWRAVIHCPR